MSTLSIGCKTYIQGIAAVVLFSLSLVVLNNPEAYKWSLGIVGVIDLYLVVMIAIAAFRSDDKKKAWDADWQLNILPTRFFGIFLMAILFFTIIISFAGVYLQLKAHFGTAINNKGDAFYVSFVTFTTLGDQYPPSDAIPKAEIIFEIISAIIFFLIALSILISRLSNMRGRKLYEKQQNDEKLRIKQLDQIIELFTNQQESLTASKELFEQERQAFEQERAVFEQQKNSKQQTNQ